MDMKDDDLKSSLKKLQECFQIPGKAIEALVRIAQHEDIPKERLALAERRRNYGIALLNVHLRCLKVRCFFLVTSRLMPENRMVGTGDLSQGPRPQ